MCPDAVCTLLNGWIHYHQTPFPVVFTGLRIVLKQNRLHFLHCALTPLRKPHEFNLNYSLSRVALRMPNVTAG